MSCVKERTWFWRSLPIVPLPSTVIEARAVRRSSMDAPLSNPAAPESVRIHLGPHRGGPASHAVGGAVRPPTCEDVRRGHVPCSLDGMSIAGGSKHRLFSFELRAHPA